MFLRFEATPGINTSTALSLLGVLSLRLRTRIQIQLAVVWGMILFIQGGAAHANPSCVTNHWISASIGFKHISRMKFGRGDAAEELCKRGSAAQEAAKEVQPRRCNTCQSIMRYQPLNICLYRPQTHEPCQIRIRHMQPNPLFTIFLQH